MDEELPGKLGKFKNFGQPLFRGHAAQNLEIYFVIGPFF
jgi:hypothetical protein